MNVHTLLRRFAGLLALSACGAALPAAALDETAADKPIEKRPAVLTSSCPKPVWPKEALRAGQQGTVTLRFRIGTDGKVVKSSVLKSSGFPLLDSAAQTGLEACSFTPAMVNGMPVEASFPVQYVWTLNGTGAKAKAKQAADAPAMQ